jgi:DNA protecting protein DprA
MPEPTIEFVAFCLQDTPGVGASTLRTFLARLARERLAPADILDLDDRRLLSLFGLRSSVVEALRSPSSDTVELWQRLRSDSVRILVLGYPGYPAGLASVLRGTAPPLLYALGASNLFDRLAVGFCGSRRASEKGLEVASDCARLLVQERINVVSGYAHGVDLAAHRAALVAGGTTTLVLAEGICHFRLKSELREDGVSGDLSRILVVSEFPPRLSWRAHNAMARNRTICGLSEALIVIESGVEGGTFEAGKAALELGQPLFCVEYAETTTTSAGNVYFLQHGATSLRRLRTGEPNLAKLLSVVREGGRDRGAGQQQELLLGEGP